MSYESKTKKIFCNNLILSALAFAIQWIIKCILYTKVYSVYRMAQCGAMGQGRNGAQWGKGANVGRALSM